MNTLLAALGAFGLKLFVSIATEKMIAKAVFYLVETLAKKTDNNIDDDLIKQLKDAYYNKAI